jgi:hypothetical protein
MTLWFPLQNPIVMHIAQTAQNMMGVPNILMTRVGGITSQSLIRQHQIALVIAKMEQRMTLVLSMLSTRVGGITVIQSPIPLVETILTNL